MNRSQMTMQIIIECKNFVTETTNTKRTTKCCKDEAFWCRHMIMRNFCDMIDWNEFNRCRAEAVDENVEFECFDFRWADWHEIINDLRLTKNERKYLVCYDVHAFFESFFCEHDKQIIDNHVKRAWFAWYNM